MPLAAADVTEPRGRIPRALFPSDDAAGFDARMVAYITEAEARDAVLALDTAAERDAAAERWVYYRAFHSAHSERLATALKRDADGAGSSAFSDAQIRGLAQQADRWLAEYQELTADAVAGPVGRARPVTRPLGIEFRF